MGNPKATNLYVSITCRYYISLNHVDGIITPIFSQSDCSICYNYDLIIINGSRPANISAVQVDTPLLSQSKGSILNCFIYDGVKGVAISL